jgi:hypothetical protein
MVISSMDAAGVRDRRGVTLMKVLLTILFFASAWYLGGGVGAAYIRSYRFQDAMKEQIRFAGKSSNYQIKQRLAAQGDSIGLPPNALQVGMRRVGNQLRIWSDYDEYIRFPFGVHAVHFHPAAEGAY